MVRSARVPSYGTTDGGQRGPRGAFKEGLGARVFPPRAEALDDEVAQRLHRLDFLLAALTALKVEEYPGSHYRRQFGPAFCGIVHSLLDEAQWTCPDSVDTELSRALT